MENNLDQICDEFAAWWSKQKPGKYTFLSNDKPELFRAISRLSAEDQRVVWATANKAGAA